jgi:outer membrane usher protein
MRHLHLQPGRYNLSDIPLQVGANEVTLEITDDTGAHKVQTVTALLDGNLLATGETEWALSGGVPSYLSNNERVYRGSYITGAAYYRRGLSDALTGEVQLQADNDVVEGGGRVLGLSPIGVLTFGAAVSDGYAGTGFAADATWSLANARILRRGGIPREAFTFSADYRSPTFLESGQYLATGDVVYPFYDYSWRICGSYDVPLTGAVTAGLNALYQLGTDADVARAPYTFTGNRYALDVSLSSPLNSWISGSLTFGYGNDGYLDPNNDKAELIAGIRLNFRPRERTYISTSYDTLNGGADLSANMESDRGTNRWDATVDIEQSGLEQAGTAAAAYAYTGNRFEVRVAHPSGIDPYGANGVVAGFGQQQSSLQVASAIAFADGKIAIGAPVRGDAFAIVYPHTSLANAGVVVGDKEAPPRLCRFLGPRARWRYSGLCSDQFAGRRAGFTAGVQPRPGHLRTATVVAVCNLPAPTASSLDFSSAISQGLPNPASTQATSIVNAQCTAPTRVQLSGNSLQTSPLGPTTAGCDNFINWTAQATFGSASVTLTTTGLTATPPVTSVAQNTATQGPTSGTISIGNIHLIAGNPVIAGSYFSTLIITIDPSL